jgi:hypothetical protein
VNADSISDILKYCEIDANDCWVWTRSRTEGYGWMWLNGRGTQVHRVTYELLVGPIPAGLVIDHLCRVRACCNPAHMEPVTRGENVLRGETITARCAAKTHCPQGHPYDEVNTYRDRNGGRYCRRCQSLRAKARRELRALQ